MLINTDPPGPPQHPKLIDMYKNHCVLSWQPPIENGGTDVLGYRVEKRLAESGRWVPASQQLTDTTQTTVTGLVDGNQYELRVIAENAVGQGPPSEPTESALAQDPWG